jgi:hypothetical protein
MEAPIFTVSDIIDREIAAGQQFGPFHRQWLLERAPEKVLRNLRLAREHPHIYGMPRQGLVAADINDPNTAAFNARNTSASEICMMGPTNAGAPTQDIINQFCAIPANDARAGKIYRLTFGGLYGNTATPTIVLTPRWGNNVTIGTNVSLGPSVAWTSITGTTALPFFGMFDFTVWTSPPGSTAGTGKGFGFTTWGVPSGTILPAVVMGGTAATIDTTGQGTAGCGLQMGITWGASSASNTSTLHYWLIQSLN